MGDDWMPLLKLPLTLEQFRRLPRNGAYKYEYFDGQAVLTPRPKHYHALLELRALEADAEVALRPAGVGDLPRLAPVFASAFRGTQPFGGLDDAARHEAARQTLEATCAGGDGPWVRQASFVATDDGRPTGAVFVTLLPAADPCDPDGYYWNEPPPPDCLARRLGRPHLTWIFVEPHRAGRGVGTALLAAAVRELLALGYSELASTFLMGNDSSTLWHWRNGFRLLPHPASPRQFRKRWQHVLSNEGKSEGPRP